MNTPRESTGVLEKAEYIVSMTIGLCALEADFSLPPGGRERLRQKAIALVIEKEFRDFEPLESDT